MVEPNEPDSSSDEETHWLIDDPEIPTQGLNRFTSLLKNCLDDVGRAVDSEISSDAPLPSLRPVPAAGPQRLRRWLPPLSQHDLPKAS